MSPHRLPPPTPKGAIADPKVASSLVSGFGYLNPDAPHEQRRYGLLPWAQDFWEKHAPELADFRCRAIEDRDAAYAEIRRWRKLQHERTRYLLLNDLLAGDALEATQKLKRQHERYEWTEQQ